MNRWSGVAAASETLHKKAGHTLEFPVALPKGGMAPQVFQAFNELFGFNQDGPGLGTEFLVAGASGGGQLWVQHHNMAIVLGLFFKRR
ncbi:hypothetical protein [Desulfovibrio sp. TomC]|uniref:hypothetical protein n=1 Tax=Desulfovibrio sp. TomC TaxID=1562888 RepID=UPI0012E2E7EA|nr:hypothetical protein [Desulfovibrio sp. TomC]